MTDQQEADRAGNVTLPGAPQPKLFQGLRISEIRAKLAGVNDLPCPPELQADDAVKITIYGKVKSVINEVQDDDDTVKTTNVISPSNDVVIEAIEG